jgi:hypothetical protein
MFEKKYHEDISNTDLYVTFFLLLFTVTQS